LKLFEELDITGCEGVHFATDSVEESKAIVDDLINVDIGGKLDIFLGFNVGGLEGGENAESGKDD
jgi:hypothetical protein